MPYALFHVIICVDYNVFMLLHKFLFVSYKYYYLRLFQTQLSQPMSVDNKEGNVQGTFGNNAAQTEQTTSQFQPPPLSEDDQFFNEEEQTADSELPNQSVPDVDVERLGGVAQYTYPANIEEGDESDSDDTPTVEYSHEGTPSTEHTQYKGTVLNVNYV